jgi:peptidoglycan hydrolase CwlO-like protein
MLVSKQTIFIAVCNGLANAALTFYIWYLYWYPTREHLTKLQEEQHKLQQLYNAQHKECDFLLFQIQQLKSTIEELEEKYTQKEQKNTELQTKLQEFIDFNYEIIE